MKSYQVIKLNTSMFSWSLDKLQYQVERLLNEKSAQGYEIISVSFGVNMWWMPTAFITIAK